jgi:hypothetical protein
VKCKFVGRVFDRSKSVTKVVGPREADPVRVGFFSVKR